MRHTVACVEKTSRRSYCSSKDSDMYNFKNGRNCHSQPAISITIEYMDRVDEHLWQLEVVAHAFR